MDASRADAHDRAAIGRWRGAMYVQYSVVEDRHLPQMKRLPFFTRERLVVCGGIAAMVGTTLVYLLA
jgi:hypothetical protein